MNITNALVVADDIAVCRILHQMLSEEQYKVETSQSVVDAVTAVEQKPFDVYVGKKRGTGQIRGIALAPERVCFVGTDNP